MSRLAGDGGHDNVPALLKAWDLASGGTNGVIVWVHGPLPVVIEDGDGVVIELIEAAEALFGTARQQAIGQPAARLLPPDDGAESERLLARCRQGQTVRCAAGRCRLGDGSVRALPLTLMSLPTGTVATIVEALP